MRRYLSTVCCLIALADARVRDADGPGWRSDFSTLTLNVGAP